MTRARARLMTGPLFAAACAAFAAGCAGGEKLTVSSASPAAEGELRCKPTSNDNTSIDLKVRHLARPERLTPPASFYVVWVRPDKDAAPQSIGALSVDEDLEGRLKTVTPLRRFELFVTAEGSGQVQAPAGEPIMWANCSL